MAAFAVMIMLPAYVQARMIYKSLYEDIAPIWAMFNSVLCFIGLSLFYMLLFMGVFAR